MQVALDNQELGLLYDALMEEKHRLLQSHLPKSQRPPPTPGRKDRLINLFNLQMKIGRTIRPRKDPAPLPF